MTVYHWARRETMVTAKRNNIVFIKPEKENIPLPTSGYEYGAMFDFYGRIDLSDKLNPICIPISSKGSMANGVYRRYSFLVLPTLDFLEYSDSSDNNDDLSIGLVSEDSEDFPPIKFFQPVAVATWGYLLCRKPS